MSLSLALRWKWGRRRNTGRPSGVGVAKEESLMGKGSKNVPCIFWLEGLKRGNGSGGKGQKQSFPFLLPFS